MSKTPGMVTVLLASHAHHTAELAINGKPVSVPVGVPTVIPAEYVALMGDSHLDFTVVDGNPAVPSVVQTVAPIGETDHGGMSLVPQASSQAEGGDSAAAAAANATAEAARLAEADGKATDGKRAAASAKRTADAKVKADDKKAKADEAKRQAANAGLPGGDPKPQDNGEG